MATKADVAEKTNTTVAEKSEWDDITLAEPVTGVKAIEVPAPILKLAESIRDAVKRDVITDGWSEEKVKEFTRYIKGAADKLGVSFRVMVTTNGGKSALRVSLITKAKTDK